ncbi:MAG: NAD-dependent epimerase/dehydratase family protein [Deltaproteobacteria bacterium]|nr:NAD-dependent epimerase/dehydratase family protein [Deltaproteobacteria bacterium]
MRVLVLGGTRFIGRAIVHELLAHGHEVLLVHRGDHEDPSLTTIPHLHCNRRELARERSVLDAYAPEGVVDTCAMTGPDAEAVLALLATGVRRVALSSVDVYRAFGSVVEETETDLVPIDEDSPLREKALPPRPVASLRGWDYDPGAYEKLQVEAAYRRVGGVALRLPAVFGEHDYQRREEPVLRRVRHGRPVPVGPGTFLWSMGYVGDIAQGVRLALEATGVEGEVFNLCERRTPTVLQRFRRIAEAAGARVEFVPVPEGQLPDDLQVTRSMAQHVLVDASKARRVLRWRESDPDEALRRSVCWHLAHPPEEPDPGFEADDRALAARAW